MWPLFNLIYLLKGILVGLAIAAPVGPVAILCIRRTLLQGRISGLMSGLGAATADLMYGFIAALGLTVVAEVLFCCLTWIEIVGALLLFFLGVKTFLAPHSPVESASLPKTSLFGDFSSTFLLTLTNPLTLFAFLGIFSALGLGGVDEDLFDAVLLLVGVFLGSTTWWLILSEGVTSFKNLLPYRIFEWVNKVAGMLLIAFGFILLINAFFEIFL